MNKISFICKQLFVLLIVLLLIPVFAFADAGKIFKDNSNSVVVVVTYNGKGEPISQGSGFIVRSDGAIVTNYHVISSPEGLENTISDGLLSGIRDITSEKKILQITAPLSSDGNPA